MPQMPVHSLRAPEVPMRGPGILLYRLEGRRPERCQKSALRGSEAFLSVVDEPARQGDAVTHGAIYEKQVKCLKKAERKATAPVML